MAVQAGTLRRCSVRHSLNSLKGLYTVIMENQLAKKVDNDMETRTIWFMAGNLRVNGKENRNYYLGFRV